jgi:hypothetical protein
LDNADTVPSAGRFVTRESRLVLLSVLKHAG